MSLTGDVNVGPGESVEAVGSEESRCRIVGNGRRIVATNVTAPIVIKNCDVVGLGSMSRNAAEIRLPGAGSLVVEGVTFSGSGRIYVQQQGNATVTFRDNVLGRDALLDVGARREAATPAVVFDGLSRGASVFQGNHVYRSWIEWAHAYNWTIGGYAAAETNVLIGLRCGLMVNDPRDTKVVGNYVHTSWDPGNSSQVSVMEVGGSGPSNVVIEHNVLRHGEWVIRGLIGELRYNLLLDVDDHNYIIGPREGALIHHNVFVRHVINTTSRGNKNSTIGLVYPARGIQIFNNTFDGGGDVVNFEVPLVSVNSQAFLDSFRSNVVTNHRFDYAALATETWLEPHTDPGPARLGYADYNLFQASPGATVRNNYELTVAGKTERVDPGFARHDVTPGGAKDEQVDPRFVGPIPKDFPFEDDDIAASRVTVAHILKTYRAFYTPAPESPLIDRGDPADGPGNDIGAIGAGTADPKDRFGTLEQTMPTQQPLPDAAPTLGLDAGAQDGDAAEIDAPSPLPERDAGADASLRADAGASPAVDAPPGNTPTDADGSDAGLVPPEDSGCGCRLGQRRPPAFAVPFVAASLVGTRLRRRKSRG